MPRSPSRSSEPPRHIRVSHPHVARNPNMRDDRTLDIVPEDRESQDILMKQPDKVKLFEQCSAGLEQDIEEAIESQAPPSFAQSEFETIIRRQRNNNPHGLKMVSAPSRFPHLDNDWEFRITLLAYSGWGSLSYEELAQEKLIEANHRIIEPEIQMGQFRSSSISGNGVVGSVFYAFPAVAAVASIFSPLALLIACIILAIYRPILLELGSAIRLNGANYIYLLQCSGKTLGAIGAAATLLDAVATSVVSAATAGAYLKGEIPNLSIQEWGIGMCLLVGIALVALISIRESSSLTLSITLIHMTVMTILMIVSAVAWARAGMDVLRNNWELRPRDGSEIARSIFNGVCIGFLGVTGFECTPSYIQNIKPQSYGPTLRNLLVMALFLNAPLMLFVYALLPSETILGGANVLSVLAEVAVGRSMRTVVVIDCLLVLCGGVFAGVVTGCRLVESLARERVLPEQFLNPLPVTGAAYMPVGLFFILSLVVYASSAFSLSTVSTMFSAVFLFTMLLYGVSCILLKFSRDRLPRAYRSSIWTVILAFVMILVVLAGNIAQNPKTLGLFVAYFVVILSGMLLPSSRLKIARIILWILDQTQAFQGWHLDRLIIRWIKHFRKDPVVVWVKEDHVNHLVEAMLYIRKNELTARVKFIHVYKDIESIPSELKANIKILDEAFPSITLDLIFIQGTFEPTLVEAASQALSIPRSQMFMSCPGKNHPWQLGDYRGVRVINF
ncbi:Transcription-associated protein 1 [Ceratobasidium theobromae]|uniref:Transcription-associated protein 1 n=1 Tax=Ceratobasidium theobromae TaxID=1582974 RepID=A0A5N5QT48_9AGAM|nr:Transcription-associated protein 1 [Ceratobasidium theobromae]